RLPAVRGCAVRCWQSVPVRCIMPDMMRLFLVVTFFVATACSMMRADSPTAIPTPTTARVVQTTPVPTLNRQLQAVPTPVSVAEATETAQPLADVAACGDGEQAAFASHIVDAHLTFREQTINVTQATTYVNRTNDALAQVVF